MTLDTAIRINLETGKQTTFNCPTQVAKRIRNLVHAMYVDDAHYHHLRLPDLQILRLRELLEEVEKL